MAADMGWRCLECGHSGSRKFPAGRCPACRSYRIQSDRQPLRVAEPEKPRKTLLELLLMLTLWGLLLYGAWDKFIR